MCKAASCRQWVAQQNANADLLAVGAVYDRAVFAVEWDECAVIDRAYSRKWAANFLLCKAPRLHEERRRFPMFYPIVLRSSQVPSSLTLRLE
jgi:hypothetical protein